MREILWDRGRPTLSWHRHLRKDPRRQFKAWGRSSYRMSSTSLRRASYSRVTTIRHVFRLSHYIYGFDSVPESAIMVYSLPRAHFPRQVTIVPRALLQSRSLRSDGAATKTARLLEPMDLEFSLLHGFDFSYIESPEPPIPAYSEPEWFLSNGATPRAGAPVRATSAHRDVRLQESGSQLQRYEFGTPRSCLEG